MYVLSGARTPFAKYVGSSRGGVLKAYSSVDLATHAGRYALQQGNVDPKDVDQLIFGMVFQTEEDAVYSPRNCALKLGLKESVPALMVQRNCASGMQAVISGVMEIALGRSDVVLCCGAESMSNIPHIVRGVREGGSFKNFKMNDFLTESLGHRYAETSMPGTAENIAQKYNIDRERMDRYAFESHKKASAARRAGILCDEIAPMEIDHDDTVREDIDLEKLRSLPSAFSENGCVTAGNACGIADGGAAIVIASEKYVHDKKCKPLGKIVDWAVVGIDPKLMGLGPVPAIRALLERVGKKISDIDLWEINEAFAAQYLGVEDELGLDPEKVNVHGGAIAIGHPLGATGVRLIHTLLLALRRSGKRFGVAAMCIGGGQGIAVLVEA